ncbi:tellurium resistance protein [Tabrizicola sp. TH137]|uniref:NUDIX domain-containing protein n=1 Tax=Tabrizicola sp. TH137 TaxID=2067452 RepID=UPI000C7E10FC|nr:NUDIX domain-containing protein [Tabrizicola sp. TH137]PLL11370.1 tellurium resistance protein [Tabrizicola sp. TH137]
MRFFFYGTLCHLPLLARVLGREAVARPAQLAGHAVFWAKGGAFPLITPAARDKAEGLLLDAVTEAEAARLDFYEGGFGYGRSETRIDTAEGPVMAQVYLPQPGRWLPGARWSLADWVARYGAAALATAGDFMALMGQWPADAVAARYGPMLTRGASRVRAAAPQPASLRRPGGAGEVAVDRIRTPYAHFFAVEEWRLGWRQFGGAMGAPQDRAVFVMTDAVTVLPYDPRRDRVLLIEQFRVGALARGDQAAWQLEAIAGRIDPGETPEEAARREALEEAGLTLGPLLPVAGYYPSPGAISEYLYSYVALTDLPDGTAGVFGAAEEAEDIRGHLISFDRMMDLAATGELTNGPMLLTALWLQRERPRLRAEAAAS